VDLQTSATFQNIPGIPITATNPTNNAVVEARSGGTWRSAAAPRRATPT